MAHPRHLLRGLSEDGASLQAWEGDDEVAHPSRGGASHGHGHTRGSWPELLLLRALHVSRYVAYHVTLLHGSVGALHLDSQERRRLHVLLRHHAAHGAYLHGDLLHVACLHEGLLHVACLHRHRLHVGWLYEALLHMARLHGHLLHLLHVALLLQGWPRGLPQQRRLSGEVPWPHVPVGGGGEHPHPRVGMARIVTVHVVGVKVPVLR